MNRSVNDVVKFPGPTEPVSQDGHGLRVLAGGAACTSVIASPCAVPGWDDSIRAAEQNVSLFTNDLARSADVSDSPA